MDGWFTWAPWRQWIRIREGRCFVVRWWLRSTSLLAGAGVVWGYHCLGWATLWLSQVMVEVAALLVLVLDWT